MCFKHITLHDVVHCHVHDLHVRHAPPTANNVGTKGPTRSFWNSLFMIFWILDFQCQHIFPTCHLITSYLEKMQECRGKTKPGIWQYRCYNAVFQCLYSVRDRWREQVVYVLSCAQPRTSSIATSTWITVLLHFVAPIEYFRVPARFFRMTIFWYTLSPTLCTFRSTWYLLANLDCALYPRHSATMLWAQTLDAKEEALWPLGRIWFYGVFAKLHLKLLFGAGFEWLRTLIWLVRKPTS